MAQRVRGNPRCGGCGLPVRACLCATLPRLRFHTPLVVVQHCRELFKPTSTGRLLAHLVEGVAVIPFGMKGVPFEPGPLADPEVEWLLLYPRAGAPVLEPRRGRRLGLVLLDGTWSQATRMSRRVPGIAGLPCVTLPPSGPSIWAVRTQLKAQNLSTIEAAIRALELVEGPERVAPLREAFARVAARLLTIKGKRPSWQP